MITAYQIRRSPISTRLFFILAPALSIFAFFSALMPRIVDSVYSNMVAGFTDTIHAAPVEYTGFVLIGDVIVLVFCLLFFGVAFGSTKIEECDL